MKFSDIKGNDAAVAVLRRMADSGKVPHALLFYENPASGGLALAMAFLQYLNCSARHDGDSCGECPSCRQMAKLIHPDVHYVFPVNKGTAIRDEHPTSSEGLPAFRSLFLSNPYFTEQELYDALGVEGKSGNISVYEAKNILDCLSLSAVSGGYRAVPLFLPERMNAACANKLLKMLEEPPAMTVFILITQDPDAVMKTIFSRCQFLRVMPPDRSSLVPGRPSEDVAALWSKLLSALLAKDLSALLDCADELEALKSREKQKAFCIFASEQLRKIFLCSKSLDDIAYIDDCDRESVVLASAAFKSSFCLYAAGCLDKASMLISRNVHAGMVFTDLVNRLYIKL